MLHTNLLLRNREDERSFTLGTTSKEHSRPYADCDVTWRSLVRLRRLFSLFWFNCSALDGVSMPNESSRMTRVLWVWGLTAFGGEEDSGLDGDDLGCGVCVLDAEEG